MKFSEGENNKIKKFIERSLLERIKKRLKRILKWHKIYSKYLSIFFPIFKAIKKGTMFGFKIVANRLILTVLIVLSGD